MKGPTCWALFVAAMTDRPSGSDAQMLPVVDREHLRELEELLGGPEALSEQIQALQEDAELRLEGIRAALGRKDAATAARLSHDFKTNAGNLGLRRVQAAADGFQRAADRSEPDLVAGFERLQAAWQEAWARLQEPSPPAD